MADIRHFGTKRHSGRYPWGSGEDPYQRSINFLAQLEEYRRLGMSESDMAKAMDITTSQLRARNTLSVAQKRAGEVSRAQVLKDTGMSNVAIGREMGINESSVRALLDPSIQARKNEIFNTMNVVRSNVDEKRYVDVGKGIEQQVGVSRTKLNAAVEMLQEEGYHLEELKVKQGTGNITIMRVLVPPDVTREELIANRDKVRMIDNYTEDGGATWNGIENPVRVNRNRVLVRYDDDGGSDRDGLIELRRGVEDISLGNAHYAQVRIAVDGELYMKGMAVHSDNIPDGFDIIYNTNKVKGTPDSDVFKKIKGADDPFGAAIRQKHYVDAQGKEHLSALNIVGSVKGAGEEGSWELWSKTLSSQVLSKQTPILAKKQLKEALTTRQEEYDEIMSLTNPAVKKRLLQTFAESSDSAAVHLKAAAMPRQASHVLLPFPSIKENEVFAPNYDDGTPVVLIRHPHGGTFEIPQLIVNNRNKEALSVIGPHARDAVGINPKVAQRLSGADFDGDTVLVIPNHNGEIKTSPALKGLTDFNPKTRYPYYEGMKVMTAHQKAMEMGNISNLITDMTIQAANEHEIARAVRHSMVVIDAEKHKLNWRLSAQDNNIAELKTKYQGGSDHGAATLISRASSKKVVDHRRLGRPGIDPETGKKIWVKTGQAYLKTGSYVKDPQTGKYIIDPQTGKRLRKEFANPKLVKRTMNSTKMAETDDAYTLSSGTRMEAIYAEHANALKTLANRARKASVEIQDTPYSPSAREVYANEVASLQLKLKNAYRNKPYERQAQLIANKELAAKLRENPDTDDDHAKKIRGQALAAARLRINAQKDPITLTDREWEAIQAGAVSSHALDEILLNTDLDAVRQRAMPRTTMSLPMSSARVLRAQTMRNNGATTAEIARTLGVSASTIKRALDEE